MSKSPETNPPKKLKPLQQPQQSSSQTKLTKHSFLEILALPVFVGVILYASQYLVVYPLYFFLGREPLTTTLGTAVLNALVYVLSLSLVLLLPRKFFPKWRTSREELGLKGLPTWADLGLAPVGFLVYFLLAMLLVAVFSLFPFFDPSEAQETGFSILATGFDKILGFLALVVLPAVFEEVIFRGWLYGKLRAKIPGKFSLLLSVLITSVLFGLLHGQWNVGVNVFAMSLVLCALREITGTIYAGILLHMLKNALAFALLYIFNFMI
ncbi:CPBP family intramembrane metalloprotease [Candidatus Saccharibacteria bacterium]|nr:CPBP family intramembrane metalloprotease [Candidatus Saccharibacteria bacterium]